jgi:selenide,water dikinase
MVEPAGPRRRLVLVGGGHSHLHVLRMLAMEPLAGARATLVSPESYATYSGMVPGTLAGLYDLAQAQVDLRALAARAGVRFVAARAERIDAAARRVACTGGIEVPYDVLSLDVGSRPAGADDPAVRRHALPLKPLPEAIRRIEAFATAVGRNGDAARAAVVGAGAGGVEVAFALAARLRHARGRVVVVDHAPGPLSGYPERVAARVLAHFAARGIEFMGGVEVEGVEAGALRLGDGRRVDAELIVWATGAAALPLPRDSGLPTDARGFLRVTAELRCVAHPDIFAAGDCAALEPYPDLPKAGVYAVREGPILWANLRAAVRGQGRLARYRPQPRFLSLLGTGDGRAILSYYGLVLDGRWVWRLKDWIDRRWVDKHRSPSPAALDPSGPNGAMGGEMAPCGGCAAKVSADLLGRVLGRLAVPADARVVVGLDAPDDAAVVAHPPGRHLVTTVDFFPPFLDDPHLVGRVAAVNAASDLYAMGAEPSAATALVALARGDEAEAEETLELLLRGALCALGEMGVALVGGHTIESGEVLFGLSMTGSVEPGAVLTKAGARPGDVLVLTKPLGTGVVLAAVRAGRAPAAWADAAIATMLRPNREAARALRAAGVRACTDVTGFGLARHLAEMLVAGRVAARLDLARLPALPGALELLGAAWRSSFHDRNARAGQAALRAAGKAAGEAGGLAGPRVELLFDPQTSGGLLAAVPPAALAALAAALDAAGDACHVIGEIVAPGPAGVVIEVGPT